MLQSRAGALQVPRTRVVAAIPRELRPSRRVGWCIWREKDEGFDVGGATRGRQTLPTDEQQDSTERRRLFAPSLAHRWACKDPGRGAVVPTLLDVAAGAPATPRLPAHLSFHRTISEHPVEEPETRFLRLYTYRPCIVASLHVFLAKSRVYSPTAVFWV